MRSSRIVSLAVVLAATGCTVSATVKTQTKFTGQQVNKTEMGTWTNQTIEIENLNGSVVVVPQQGLTQISVSTTPFAFADVQADAQPALADVTASVTIDESQPGKVYVHCAQSSKPYGSAGQGTTGCDSFTVNVPAAAVALSATAHNGPIQTNGVITAGASQVVKIHSDNGDATASLTPSQGSQLEASSGNGNVTLSLPSSFAADAITMTTGNGMVTVTGFATDFTNTSTSRGTAGTGANSITAHTDNGDVEVKAQ